MLDNPISGIAKTVANTFNPVPLAIARRGYRIQSNILSIPDRYGYFSPGPPQLQARQASVVMILLGMAIFGFFILAGSASWTLPETDREPLWKAAVCMAGLLGTALTLIWIAECNSKYRAPGYELEFRKLRKD